MGASCCSSFVKESAGKPSQSHPTRTTENFSGGAKRCGDRSQLSPHRDPQLSHASKSGNGPSQHTSPSVAAATHTSTATSIISQNHRLRPHPTRVDNDATIWGNTLTSASPSDAQEKPLVGGDFQVEAWVRQSCHNRSSTIVPPTPPTPRAVPPPVFVEERDNEPADTVVVRKGELLGMTSQTPQQRTTINPFTAAVVHSSPTANLSAQAAHQIPSSSWSSGIGGLDACSSDPPPHAATNSLLPSLPLEVGQDIAPLAALTSADVPASSDPLYDWAGFYAALGSNELGDPTAVGSKSTQTRLRAHRRLRSGGEPLPVSQGNSTTNSGFGGSSSHSSHTNQHRSRSQCESHRASLHGSTQRAGSFVSVLSPCQVPNPSMLTSFPEGGSHPPTSTASQGSHRLHPEGSADVRSVDAQYHSCGASRGTMSGDFGTVVEEADTMSRGSDFDLFSDYAA
jgi:hypothetical protein